MAIRRKYTYEEVIDSTQTNTITGSFDDVIESKEKNNTQITDYAQPESPEPPGEQQRQQEIIGRTPSDLIHELASNPAAIVTILFILPIAIFVFGGDVTGMNDLKSPLFVGVILNVSWFGIKMFQAIVRTLRR